MYRSDFGDTRMPQTLNGSDPKSDIRRHRILYQHRNIHPFEGIGDRLNQLTESIVGINTKVVAESQEVTILADKSVPFTVVKKVMSTCTSQGYTQISLAVMQKAPEALAI